MNNIYIWGIIPLLASGPAHAVLKPSDVLGTSTVTHQVAGKRPEICIVPQHFAEGKYKKKDQQHETEICNLDIDVNVAACAKTYSTNPGVLFMSPPAGSTPADIKAKNCDVEGARKEAKYKLSTSCSYTPSLLAYYHMSRMLGDVLNVPVAVVRTLDIDRHKTLAAQALKEIGKPEKTIYKTWAGLKAILDDGLKSDKADALLVEGGDQSYGALQRNPRGEDFYLEFFHNADDRVKAFKKDNKIYRALISPELTVGREWTQLNVQALQQLKDAADFIVLDTILSQQDRMGNIHFKEQYYYPTKKDGKFKIKTEDDKETVPQEFQGKALLVKEMMLKDNDCGVIKGNRIKEAKLLDAVAHIDPGTYKRVLRTAAAGDANKELFTRGMLFTEADYRKVMDNLKEAAALLKGACQAGRLKLDLDPENHFGGEPAKQDCDGV